MRPSFLVDLSAAEARRNARAGRRFSSRARARDGRQARFISHEMSRRYVLEHPVDLPDEDDDEEDEDDLDGDDDDEDDEDEDEEEVETWQVSDLHRSAKGRSLLDFRDRTCLDWPRFSSSVNAGQTWPDSRPDGL